MLANGADIFSPSLDHLFLSRQELSPFLLGVPELPSNTTLELWDHYLVQFLNCLCVWLTVAYWNFRKWNYREGRNHCTKVSFHSTCNDLEGYIKKNLFFFYVTLPKSKANYRYINKTSKNKKRKTRLDLKRGFLSLVILPQQHKMLHLFQTFFKQEDKLNLQFIL